jgi:hypothetical protein
VIGQKDTDKNQADQPPVITGRGFVELFTYQQPGRTGLSLA